MRIYIDDSFTSIRLTWKENGEVKNVIIENSFKPERLLNPLPIRALLMMRSKAKNAA